MGYPTKVQLIKRKASQQWYVNFPAVLAQAMEFEKGETVEWVIKDRYAHPHVFRRFVYIRRWQTEVLFWIS